MYPHFKSTRIVYVVKVFIFAVTFDKEHLATVLSAPVGKTELCGAVFTGKSDTPGDAAG